MSLNKRLLLSGLGTLSLLLAWQGAIEQHALYTPLAAPVLFVLYAVAVLLPWLVLGRIGGKSKRQDEDGWDMASDKAEVKYAHTEQSHHGI
jgi:hypothetical protein